MTSHRCFNCGSRVKKNDYLYLDDFSRLYYCDAPRCTRKAEGLYDDSNFDSWVPEFIRRFRDKKKEIIRRLGRFGTKPILEGFGQ